MEYKDYYKILDTGKHADSEEISKAYRKLARRYHPDVNPGDTVAEERYKEINEAYTVLNHADARAKYDRLSAKWEFHQSADEANEFEWNEWLFIPGLDGQEPELPAAIQVKRSPSKVTPSSTIKNALTEYKNEISTAMLAISPAFPFSTCPNSPLIIAPNSGIKGISQIKSSIYRLQD